MYTPMKPVITPKTFDVFIFSSSVRKCAAITVNIGTVAIKIAVVLDAICICPHVIKHKGITFLSMAIIKYSNQTLLDLGSFTFVTSINITKNIAAPKLFRKTKVNGSIPWSAIAIKK